ncbi:hypothetical protein PIB30_031545 [Stylosanthes scabra]|uniref:Transposase (putative) gypsy type domain-containing protein n=1 Tax=Stylosanthes scabra TaxID=79078 RepID=A0ABU6QBE9_9FABA|nr:hypothetical protein [Stylosanthes scabra]
MAENPDGNQEVEAAPAVQMPHEVSPLYRWVFPDVLGAPSALNQAYLDELKATGIIFSGGELERRYKHPTIPHWLWVNEVMFTEFGIRVPYSDFQQRLLNYSSIAPSQLHPNAWASIQCFELVTEWLGLPQEPEVFMTLFTFYFSNTSGKTKKGYMSVRPTSKRKIFGLFEDSFHNFKGRYFKIVSVGAHRLFWLSVEGDGRFPSYWSDKAGFDVAPAILSRPEEAFGDIGRLRGLVRQPAVGGVVGATTSTVVPARSVPSSAARAITPPVGLTPRTQDDQPPPSPKKRSMSEGSTAAKKQRTEGSSCEFTALDRSFDASGFVATHLLVPKAQEALRDYDPAESI